eukprot:1724474-Rhodomonas_salina.4
MSGTDVVCGAMRCWVLTSRMVLPGRETRTGFVSLTSISVSLGRISAMVLRLCYAMSGTDPARGLPSQGRMAYACPTTLR